MDQQANAYSLFQTAITLEGQVRMRTEEVTQCAGAPRAHQRRAVERTRCFRARQPLQDALLHRRRSRPAAAAARRPPFGQRTRRAERQRAPTPHRRAHRACADDDRGAAEVDPRHFQTRGGRRDADFAAGGARRAVRLDHSRPRAAGADEGPVVDLAPQRPRRRLRSADAPPHPAEPFGQRGPVHGEGRHSAAGAPPRARRAHRGMGHRSGHRRGRP